MVRLNIDALKAEWTSQGTSSEPVSSVESAILSVDQIEIQPSSVKAEDTTASSDIPSRLDLLESDEVKFGVDFYDNSLVHELGNEADVADLLVQGVANGEEELPEKAPETPIATVGISAKLNLTSLASDISAAEEEKTTSEESVIEKVEQAFIPQKPVEESISETSTPASFSPKIGKKIEVSATPKESVDAEKTSEKIEDFFPNLIVGFEEDEKVEYVREVAKNLSESRKGGLVNLFGKNALVHTAIAVVALGWLVALSVFTVPKIFNNIKGSSFEAGKTIATSKTLPNPPDSSAKPRPENPNQPAGKNPDVPPSGNPQPIAHETTTPPTTTGSSLLPLPTVSGSTTTPPKPVVVPPIEATYTEGVDYHVVQ